MKKRYICPDISLLLFTEEDSIGMLSAVTAKRKENVAETYVSIAMSEIMENF